MERADIRHDWTQAEVEAILDLSFSELVFRAMEMHRRHHDASRIQLCTLSNIKRGGCPEDCGYCPQSAHFDTAVRPEPMLAVDDVRAQARSARAAGATRFCMGAAWRKVRDDAQFERVLEMVRAVSGEGVEVCATLGMMNVEQARRLKEAGLTAYNHNLDTSSEHYGSVITTRSFGDRLATLDAVREAGLSMCCGGIVGLGESRRDRAALLRTLASFEPHPESVPINRLVRAPGTPLEHADELDTLEWLRTLAAARILMPKAKVRLAAGRTELSREAQMLAYLCGANSIFFGEELLTTPNPKAAEDRALLAALGLEPMAPVP